MNKYWREIGRGVPEKDGCTMGISLDSAYYLSELSFDYPLEFSMMTFPAICGRWQLPSNQGYAQIHAKRDEEANIRYYVCMTASG